MYRGRFQLGQLISLGVQCTLADGVASAPDAAPQMRIYTGPVPAQTAIVARSIPVQDRNGTTGLFVFPQLLDSRFGSGTYCALYLWTVGGVYRDALDQFEVIDGGAAGGQVISAAWFPRGASNFLIYQTDSGTLNKGRNPA